MNLNKGNFMTNQPTPDDMIYYCFAAKMRGYNSLALDRLKYLFVSFFDMEDSEVHIGYYGEAPDSLLDIGRLSDNDTQLIYFATKVKINSWALRAFTESNNAACFKMESHRQASFIQPVMAFTRLQETSDHPLVLSRSLALSAQLRDECVYSILGFQKGLFARKLPMIVDPQYPILEDEKIFPESCGKVGKIGLNQVVEKILEKVRQYCIDYTEKQQANNKTKERVTYINGADPFDLKEFGNLADNAGVFCFTNGHIQISDSTYHDGGNLNLIPTATRSVNQHIQIKVELSGIYKAYVEFFAERQFNGSTWMCEGIAHDPVFVVLDYRDGSLNASFEVCALSSAPVGRFTMFASGLLDTVGTRIDEYFRDYEIDYDDVIVVRDADGWHTLCRHEGFIDAITLIDPDRSIKTPTIDPKYSDVLDAIKHFMVEAGHRLLMKDNLSGGNLKGVHKGVAYNWFIVHADTVVVTEYPKGKQ